MNISSGHETAYLLHERVCRLGFAVAVVWLWVKCPTWGGSSRSSPWDRTKWCYPQGDMCLLSSDWEWKVLIRRPC